MARSASRELSAARQEAVAQGAARAKANRKLKRARRASARDARTIRRLRRQLPGANR